ncbi:MAG: PH domain-containing protein [Crocinitomicaceae bacterium]|nr:PH domain-containing protein [Crocinitomicaceae bacterium]MCF8410208.1 PH domain-containing protein [Crocinitomicaceae bacterium]MCF8444430.1 PH domain-containing protein [Crocinitomicaceae bacterium]
MIFRAKRDWFFGLIWLFVFVLYSFIGLIEVVVNQSYESLLILYSISVSLGILFIVIQRSTSYEIREKDVLICKMLFFKKQIPIQTIRKIERANGLYVGWKMNTSWKCLVVHYNKYDELLISPEKETEFIREITRLNNSISITLVVQD